MSEVDVFKVLLFPIPALDGGYTVVILKILNDKNHNEKFFLKLLIALELNLK